MKSTGAKRRTFFPSACHNALYNARRDFLDSSPFGPPRISLSFAFLKSTECSPCPSSPTWTRQTLKCFSRAFLYQRGRNDGQGGKGLGVTVHVDSAERDQGLASPALRDYRRAPCLVPALYHAHHCERLRRKRLAEELPGQRRSCVVKALQRRVALKDSLT